MTSSSGLSIHRTLYQGHTIDVHSLGLTQTSRIHYAVYIDEQIIFSSIADTMEIAVDAGVTHAQVTIDRSERTNEGAE